jgi:topoisomerase-4 subunit A
VKNWPTARRSRRPEQAAEFRRCAARLRRRRNRSRCEEIRRRPPYLHRSLRKVTMSDAKNVSVVDEPTTLIVSRHGWLRSRQRPQHRPDATHLPLRRQPARLPALPHRRSPDPARHPRPRLLHRRRRNPRRQGRWRPGHLAGRFPGWRQALSGAGRLERQALSGRRRRRLRLPLQGRGFHVTRQGRQGFPDAGRNESPAVFMPAPAEPAKSPAFTKDGRRWSSTSKKSACSPRAAA